MSVTDSLTFQLKRLQRKIDYTNKKILFSLMYHSVTTLALQTNASDKWTLFEDGKSQLKDVWR